MQATKFKTSSKSTDGISNYNYDEIIILNISESARFMESKYIGLFAFDTTDRNCDRPTSSRLSPGPVASAIALVGELFPPSLYS